MSPPDERREIELEESYRFEALLMDLSSKFVNLPASEVDREIENAQRRICECLGLDVCSLWQWTSERFDDLQIIRGDGAMRWISSRGRPYFSSAGSPETLMGISIGVIQERRARGHAAPKLETAAVPPAQ